MSATVKARAETLTHAWQDRGYEPPYTLIECISVPHPKSPAFLRGGAQVWDEARQVLAPLGASLGSCDVCGTAILNHYLCVDATGKHFVVGSDCVEKLGDEQLVTQVEKLKRERRRDERRKKIAADQAARVEAFQARRDEERQRNGGLTDYEVLRRDEALAEAANAEANAKAYGWIIAVLQATPGGFARDMVRVLQTNPGSLTGRMRTVIAEIYVKAQGISPRNSKFDDQCEAALDRLALCREESSCTTR